MNINPRKHKPRNPYRCRSYNSSAMTVPSDDDVNHTADQIMVSPLAFRLSQRENSRSVVQRSCEYVYDIHIGVALI